MSKTLIPEANGVTFSGVNHKYFTGALGEELSIEVNLPDELAVGETYNNKSIEAIELTIDPFTPLPEGLEFDGEMISGTPEEACNMVVHVLVNLTLEGQTSPVVFGAEFELFIPLDGEEVIISDIPEEPVTPVEPVNPPTSSSEPPVDPGSTPVSSSEPAQPSSETSKSSEPAESSAPVSSSEQKATKKSGCGGSIAATSSLIALVAAACAGVIALKRRKED